MTDIQVAGLLDLVISQDNDIFELKVSTYALTKLARQFLGDQMIPLYEQFAQDLRTEATKRGRDSRIELLESMSLQLKQSGQPIQ
jgi:hypothetical protein